jgi:hypothetical protein
MLGSIEGLRGGTDQGYVEKAFSNTPFREDVIYHGIPAMAEVGMAMAHDLPGLGLDQNMDVRHLRYKIGVLVDEQKHCVCATMISDEEYAIMEDVYKEHPNEQWVDVKRKVFLEELSKRDKEVAILEMALSA